MDSEIERWKSIEEFPNYEVSDWGRVMRITKGRGTRLGLILKGTIGKDGYPCVLLKEKNKLKLKRIHQLVLNAFVGKYKKPFVANHKDMIKTNNHIENLEIITHTENLRHAWNILPKKSKPKRKWLRPEEIWLIKKILYNKNKKEINITFKQIGKIFKKSEFCISRIYNGNRWSNIKYP